MMIGLCTQTLQPSGGWRSPGFRCLWEGLISWWHCVCVVTSSSCSVGPETFVVCRLESHPGWFHGCWPWQRDGWRASFSLMITLLIIDNDRCVFLPSGEVWRNRKRFIKIFSTHQPVRVLCALNLQHKHPNINESHHGLASGWLTVDRVGSGPDSEPVRLDYSKPEGNNLTFDKVL